MTSAETMEGAEAGVSGLCDTTSPSSQFDFAGDHMTECLFCEVQFLLPQKMQDFLVHLFHQHRFVICRTNEIAHMKGYIDYWRIRFQSSSVALSSSTFLVYRNSGDNEAIPHYFLSDANPEDKLLREGLHGKRLEWILEQQEVERKNNITRHCLLCQLDFTGPRFEYFKHLNSKHNLKLGSPDNLVFTDEFLDVVDDKLRRKECLFCGGIFKSLAVLKEHMRKKQHKRINPEDKSFDKFFVVNYLEMGKNWEQIQAESDDSDDSDDSDAEASGWSDWEDEGQEIPVICLFCNYRSLIFIHILEHMKYDHDFDYNEIIKTRELPFYEQVKLVNYIRKQLSDLICSYCIEKFESRDELLDHMASEDHCEVPAKALWDHPKYFVPNYECDSFLCHLHDIEDSEDDLQ